MNAFHYTSCGLDNVFITGMNFYVDDAGQRTFHIPRINLLHKVIAEGIVRRPGTMSAAEIRFLRTEMGLSQNELADIMAVKRLTVGRWERGEIALPAVEETFIRKLAIDRLMLPVRDRIDELTNKVVSLDAVRAINISAQKDAYALDVAA